MPRATRSPAAESGAGHRDALDALGLEGEVRRRLEAYLEVLSRWNPRVNLTAARTPEARVRLLVAPGLVAGPWVVPGRLLDVGSGNGSPGLVLALLREDVQAVLLEPRQRRWAFLKEAARAAGRPEVEVLRLRHDAYVGPAADTVTLRGLALPLSALRPLARVGGRVIVFGGHPAEEPPFRREGTVPLGRGHLHVFLRADAAPPSPGVPRET